MSADTRVWNKVMPFRFPKFWFKKNVLHSLLTLILVCIKWKPSRLKNDAKMKVLQIALPLMAT